MFSYLGKNHIGYQVSALGNHVFFGVNPLTGDQFSTSFVQASPEEVELALKKAQQAFIAMQGVSIDQRLAFIQELVCRIQSNKELLIEWFCQESALPKERAESELNRACYQFAYYAGSVKTGYALEIKIDDASQNPLNSSKPKLVKMNLPIGPVVVFGASNFPFAYSTLGGDVASALVAGCPVIVKAHPMHPHTSSISAQLIVEAAEATGMPEGVFSHLLAADYTVGESLVRDARVQAVGFTGSIAGGMALQRIINQRNQPIPLYAEMGSCNPLVVSSRVLDEQAEEIALKISNSVALNAGQFCTSPGLLFVVKSKQADDLLNKLQANFQAQKPQCMLHPGIAKRYRDRVDEQRKFVRIIVEQETTGNFICPVLAQVSGEVFLATPSVQEEVFGSFLLAVVCETEDQLLTCLNSLHGQLTATLFKKDDEQLVEIVRVLSMKAGRLIFNGVPTGVEVSFAQQHGGPFPSSSNPYFSSVGWDAVKRFVRPITYQLTNPEWYISDLEAGLKAGVLHFLNGKYQ